MAMPQRDHLIDEIVKTDALLEYAVMHGEETEAEVVAGAAGGEEGEAVSSKAEAFARLAKSKFRSRFRLDDADRAYIARVGMVTIRRHAEDFVRMKLAPSEPEKDGRQTPMRGHPVFKAMHGSAMCCRGCMEKWWKVPRHRPLSSAQQQKAVDFLMEWIARRNMVE